MSAEQPQMITCPSCGKRYSLSDFKEDKLICSACGREIPRFLSVGANYGVQLGLANLIDSGHRDDEERCGGLQIGLYNDSDAPGVQIGLLNHNPKAWLPWMPLVNCCFREE